MNALQGRPSWASAPRLTLASTSYDMRPLGERLRALRPDWPVRIWPEPGFEQGEVLVGWSCPPGLVASMPGLRLLHGIAAGVDSLVDGQALRGLPVCRVIDEQQVIGMNQYVLWSVLYFHRELDRVIAQQANREWRRPVLREASEWRVGVMGLGAMGASAARTLVANGYAVSGWSRTPKRLPGVETFSGAEALPAFLGRLDTLVCLLPLTPSTRGILGRALFETLPPGATLVHAGRGEHLVADEVRAALQTGRLRGAVVDVFPREPLPAADPLWRTPGLLVTPHMATMTSLARIGEHIVANVERLAAGQPLVNQVDASPYLAGT